MRDHFYKYTDIQTAEAILKNQTFRYSSPLKFNDPFDIQNELVPDFDLNDFPEATMAVIEDYVKNDYPIPDSKNSFAQGILLLRDGAKSQGYKKSEIEKISYPLLGYVQGEINHLISQLNSHWHKSMRDSRVFCVTEDNDNLLMWAHYAKDHTGAVFQVATMPEADTPLSVARKVEYKDKPVKFLSLEELVRWTLFGIAPDPTKLLYSNHAYRKSKVWRYENEWRVVDMCHYERKKELYVDHKFIPEQLQKIFFGFKADVTVIEHLRKMAEKINPGVDIYRAKKQSLEYALKFEKI